MGSEDEQAWVRKHGLQGVGRGGGEALPSPGHTLWLAAPCPRLLASQTIFPSGERAGCKRQAQRGNWPIGKPARWVPPPPAPAGWDPILGEAPSALPVL